MSSVEIPRCQHIKVNGLQCGSPALHHKRFCYFHQAWRQNTSRRPRENGSPAKFELPPLEDANSIQMALMHVTRLIVAGKIDNKQAGLLLYALQTASINLKRLTLEPDWQKVVVNPAAVRFSPIEMGAEQIGQQQENSMLSARTFPRKKTGAAAEPGYAAAASPAPGAAPTSAPLSREAAETTPASAASEPPRPSATWAGVCQITPHSPHYLPTSPDQWNELKEKDWSAWLRSSTALIVPPKVWSADPEQLGDGWVLVPPEGPARPQETS
jgi:hypothetical protein